jgi:hypothetical protein
MEDQKERREKKRKERNHWKVDIGSSTWTKLEGTLKLGE